MPVLPLGHTDKGDALRPLHVGSGKGEEVRNGGSADQNIRWQETGVSGYQIP
jgi:hypothetical protein